MLDINVVGDEGKGGEIAALFNDAVLCKQLSLVESFEYLSATLSCSFQVLLLTNKNPLPTPLMNMYLICSDRNGNNRFLTVELYLILVSGESEEHL